MKKPKLEPCGVCGGKAIRSYDDRFSICESPCCLTLRDPNGAKWNRLMRDAAAGRAMREGKKDRPIREDGR